MTSELKDRLDHLRSSNATASPSARLRAIRQRLAATEGETASARLVTALSAVESLARSLVVHAPQRPRATAEIRYQQVRATGPVELVTETLRLYRAGTPGEVFGDETWDLFQLSHEYRNLVVHECTGLGLDRSPGLVAAAERVLEGLVQVGGLLRAV